MISNYVTLFDKAVYTCVHVHTQSRVMKMCTGKGLLNIAKHKNQANNSNIP